MSAIWIGHFLLTGAFPSMKYKRLFFLKFKIFTLLIHLLHNEGKMMQCSLLKLLWKKSLCASEMFLVNLFERWIFLPSFYIIHNCVCSKCTVVFKAFNFVLKKRRKRKQIRNNGRKNYLVSQSKHFGLVPFCMCVCVY